VSSKTISRSFNAALRTLLLGLFLNLGWVIATQAGETEMKPQTLEAKLRKDVEDLHAFFVGWYNASLPENAFESEFMARLDPGFTIIMPSGVRLDHKTLVSSMRGSYGKKPGFRIEIRNVRVVHVTESSAVAQYEEWQRNDHESPGSGSGRVSTVIFSLGDELQWLHVHETWLPEDIVAADHFDF